MTAIPYILADGSYDVALIMRSAHNRARQPRADWQAPATYAQRLASAMEDFWVLAKSRRLIWQMRQIPRDDLATVFTPAVLKRLAA
jgi:hypothetical protein